MANFTPQELVKEWQNRTASIEPKVRVLVKFTGKRMLQKARVNMLQMIYDIPEDTTASGKKKWVRTKQLFLHEQLEFAPNGSAVTLTNDMVYARSRHELGRDGRKTKRPAHWRDGIAEALRPGVIAEAQRLRDWNKR